MDGGAHAALGDFGWADGGLVCRADWRRGCSMHFRATTSAGLIGVIVCIVLNWFGDSMDGTLARVRNQQRPRYGFYVDHIVDIFGATAMMCGLGFSGFVHWQVAVAMLIGFLAAFGGELSRYLHACPASRCRRGCSGRRRFGFCSDHRNPGTAAQPLCDGDGASLLLFDLGGTIAAVAMFAMAIAIAVRHTAELYRQEPLR